MSLNVKGLQDPGWPLREVGPHKQVKDLKDIEDGGYYSICQDCKAWWAEGGRFNPECVPPDTSDQVPVADPSGAA